MLLCQYTRCKATTSCKKYFPPAGEVAALRGGGALSYAITLSTLLCAGRDVCGVLTVSRSALLGRDTSYSLLVTIFCPAGGKDEEMKTISS